MKHIPKVAFIAVLALFAFGSTADAYKANSSGGKTLRWADSSLPLAWYMNMNGYKGVSAADAEGAFKHGMAQWSAPTCSKFRTVYKGTS